MLKRSAKFLGWLVSGTIAVAMLSYLVLLVINWRDAKPSEPALHFSQLHAQRPAVADEVNGYVYLVGMSVKPELDSREAGLAIVRRARESNTDVYQHPGYPQASFHRLFGNELQELKKACRSLEEKCLPLLAKNNLPFVVNDAAGKVVLRRYRDLLGYTEWQDIYTNGFESPIPDYNAVVDGQFLFLFDTFQHVIERAPAETIALLELDATYWRNVLRASGSLITSMVATNNLKRNMIWTNLALRKGATGNKFNGGLSVWANAINRDERQMVRNWAGEMAILDHAIRNTTTAGFYRLASLEETEPSALGNMVDMAVEPFLLHQETLNRIAESRLSLIHALDVSFDAVPEVTSQIRDKYAADDHGISFPGVLRNPVGKIIEAVSPTDELPYMLKVADLEGGRRALLATLQLRSDKIPREKVAEALAVSAYRNPYTNQPFIWDEASGCVVFEGLGEGKQKRYLFPY